MTVAFHRRLFYHEFRRIGSDVTGDAVGLTTMEHRNIRPVAWAQEQFYGLP